MTVTFLRAVQSWAEMLHCLTKAMAILDSFDRSLRSAVRQTMPIPSIDSHSPDPIHRSSLLRVRSAMNVDGTGLDGMG